MSVVIINEKLAMKLKESKKGYMGGFKLKKKRNYLVIL